MEEGELVRWLKRGDPAALEALMDRDTAFACGVASSILRDAPRDVEEVVLQCDRLCGRYVETKPLHESQRHRWQDEDCLEVTLRVMVNAELESTILRHGEGMTVVRPAWLQERIASRLRASLRHYAVPAVVPTAEEQ